MTAHNIHFTRKYSVTLVRHEEDVHGMILQNVVTVGSDRYIQGWKFVSTSGDVQLATSYNEAQRKAADHLLQAYA